MNLGLALKELLGHSGAQPLKMYPIRRPEGSEVIGELHTGIF